MNEEFDWGLYEQILQKLSAGGALTPEEKAAYDALFAGAGQGLDLTGQPDFAQLVNSFYNDSTQQLTKEFERVYGEGVVMGPDGRITFTRPGSAMEAQQRRGQSVLDGPAQGILSEGLTEFNSAKERAREAALRNAYTSMVPVRQQNLDAVFRAGTLAQGSANRRVGALGGARRSGGGEGVGGPGGEPLRLPLPEQPDLWDRILPGLVGALGTGGLALLRDQMRPGAKDPQGPMQKFGKEVPEPPTRPYPSADPMDAIENQRATPGTIPLTTGNALGNEQYSEDMMNMYMGGANVGQTNAIAPAFDASKFTPNLPQTQQTGFSSPLSVGDLSNPYEEYEPGAFAAPINQQWQGYQQPIPSYMDTGWNNQPWVNQSWRDIDSYTPDQYNYYEDQGDSNYDTSAYYGGDNYYSGDYYPDGGYWW